jgi:uncharacterized membrane protein YdjX (TVP38/TMEM64 family)
MILAKESFMIVLDWFHAVKDWLSSVDVNAVAGFLRGLGPWARVIGGLFIILQTFFPFVPFLILAGANVLVFGLIWGVLINWLSAVVASILMFYAARTFGRSWAKRKMKRSKYFHTVNRLFRRVGFKTILLIRVFPVIPPAAVNLAAGVSTISARPFILATFMGKLPPIIVESMIGYNIFHFAENKVRFFVILLAFGAVILIGIKILKKKISVS